MNGHTTNIDSLLAAVRYNIRTSQFDPARNILDSLSKQVEYLSSEQKTRYYLQNNDFFLSSGDFISGTYFWNKAKASADKLPKNNVLRFQTYLAKIKLYSFAGGPKGTVEEEESKQLTIELKKMEQSIDDFDCFTLYTKAKYHRLVTGNLDSAIKLCKINLANKGRCDSLIICQNYILLATTYRNKAAEIAKQNESNRQNHFIDSTRKYAQLGKEQAIHCGRIAKITVSNIIQLSLNFKYGGENTLELLNNMKAQYEFLKEEKAHPIAINFAHDGYLHHAILYYDKIVKKTPETDRILTALINERNEFKSQRSQFNLARNKVAFYQILELEELEKNKLIAKNRLILIFLIGIGSLSLILFLYYKIRQGVLNKKLAEQNFEKDKMLTLLDGRELERKSIALELHDEVANILAGIRHNISAIKRKEEFLAEPVNRSLSQIDFLYHKIRNLSHIIDMPAIEEEQFSALVSNLVEEYEEVDDFQIEYSLFPKDQLDTLEYSLRKHLFLIIQELLLNTYKHASANDVSLSLSCIQDQIILVYYDNGNGISENKTDPLPQLKQRVDILKGQLHIDSKENKGLTITIEIPYNNSKPI